MDKVSRLEAELVYRTSKLVEEIDEINNKITALSDVLVRLNNKLDKLIKQSDRRDRQD